MAETKRGSPAYRMADRLLNGKLEIRLRSLRSNGYSYQEIARMLFADAGVEVSAETLRAWARHLGIGKDGEAA